MRNLRARRAGDGSTPIEPVLLRAMTEVIVHRGPDKDGHHITPGIAMGMRRLSIIDLASSHQPLSNERGDVWTVFNGEIFNLSELRTELQSRGHRLATEGDTETIVHLYEEHGPDFPKRLRGMFGIAGLPDDRRILHGRRKEILRRVSRGLLDDATIDKKKRGFFCAASSTWLHTHRDGIFREALLDERARGRGIFVPGAIENLIAHSQGSGRAGEPLLAVLLLELWHRQFVDADGAGRRLVRKAKRIG